MTEKGLMAYRGGEIETRLATAEHQRVARPSDSLMVQRADNSLQTHLAAVRAKTTLGVAGQREIAGLWANAVDVQDCVVNRSFDVVARQAGEDRRVYMQAITEQAIELMNQDEVRVTRIATQGIQAMVEDYDLPRPDTRNPIVRYFKPFPDE